MKKRVFPALLLMVAAFLARPEAQSVTGSLAFNPTSPAGTSSQTVPVTYDDGKKGPNNSHWTLKVSASGTTFNGTGCPSKQPPASSISVSCSVVTSGGGTLCTSAFQPVTTAGVVVAQGTYNGNGRVTVNLNLKFTDGWNYAASTGTACSLQVNYIITYP